MSDISTAAVENFIQTVLKEAVLSEGMPRTHEDTRDAYSTVNLLRALTVRIEALESALAKADALACAVADNAWRTDYEKKALIAYRTAREATK